MVDRNFQPDSEVIPGVKWGSPEWIPTPAFWAAMSDLADQGHDYVCSEMTLKEHVGFCLIGGFGITAEMNHAVYDHLAENGVFASNGRATSNEIETLLREPVSVKGRMRRYRFPRQRSLRLTEAFHILEEKTFDPSEPKIFRTKLMEIPGIGPKTASWIVRNWLGSDDVAILDVHIVRAGLLIGLFSPENALPRDYEAMESRFLAFARAIEIRPSLLDAVMWREMRILGPH